MVLPAAQHRLQGLLLIFSGLLFCSFVSANTALKFPMLPASFEETTYNGTRGCIADNENTSLVMAGIASNEALDYIGSHAQIQTPIDGVFIMDIFYGAIKSYGYILENRGLGKRCIQQKITYLKLGDRINRNLSQQKTITPQDCTFAPQVINLCGTLRQLIERLEKADYKTDWQATNEDGHTITMLSGTGQSWILTTHKDTGATIFTGAGKGEFDFHKGDKGNAK